MLNYIHRRFVFLIIVILLAMVTVFSVMYFKMHNDVIALRRDESKKQSVLFKVAITETGNPMLRWIYDNTYWDEMCSFVKSKNAKWARINIEEAIPLSNIDAVWIFDKQKRIIYSYNIWNDSQFFQLPFSNEETNSILEKEKILGKNNPHFYSKISNKVFELRVLPIQPSSDLERTTEPQGYLVGAKMLDKRYFKEISKITFSDVLLFSPDYLDDFQKLINDSDVLVGDKIQLADYFGKHIAYLGTIYDSNPLDKLIFSSRKNLFIIIICILVLVGATIIALLFWVVRPLKIITKSLIAEDGILLHSLSSTASAFGLIASLINQFFEQRKSLQNEIENRTEVEKELRQIKSNLENIVEERTVDLLKAKEKAEEANKLKSIFLTNMSHELRTPLFGIIGNADLLSDSQDQLTQKLASLISRSGNRLKETLNQLLDLAKLESGRMDLKVEEYSITEIIKNIVEFYDAEAKTKGLQLRVNLPDKNIIAKIDLKVFEDAVNNLVQNAIKFTFAGEVLVNVKYDDKEFIISVVDSGIGIPEEKLEVIFDQFRQVSEGIGRNYEGSGLGLALTNKYVELLGGTIAVSSKVNVGSEFSIKLPLHSLVSNEENNNSKNLTCENSENDDPLLDKQIPILLVEDDPITQGVVKQFLNKLFIVDVAVDRKDAINKLLQKNYMAVLMDMHLGSGPNGIQITQEIRNMPGKEKLPIIAETAFAMKGDMERFLDAGCDYYLSKPFSKEELTNILLKIYYETKNNYD